jgi:hypothetical protein
MRQRAELGPAALSALAGVLFVLLAALLLAGLERLPALLAALTRALLLLRITIGVLAALLLVAVRILGILVH